MNRDEKIAEAMRLVLLLDKGTTRGAFKKECRQKLNALKLELGIKRLGEITNINPDCTWTIKKG